MTEEIKQQSKIEQLIEGTQLASGIVSGLTLLLIPYNPKISENYGILTVLGIVTAISNGYPIIKGLIPYKK